MNKRLLLIALLSAMALLLGFSTAMASHIDITVLKSDGAPAGPTDAYSPKQTCGGCHFNCATSAYSTDKTTWCNSYAAKKDCSDPGNCPDYESLATTTVTKVQGYGTSSGVVFQYYNVKSPTHGASIGKHSQQGRNEEFTAAQRSIWGAPAFASSPGMWGRY